MLGMNAVTDKATARVRLLEAADDHVVIGLPGTQYRIRLGIESNLDAQVGKRTRGRIVVPVWKVDFVNAGGGSFVEPIYGEPRRVQGPVIDIIADRNAVVVEVYDTPFVGVLAQRYKATDIKPGTRVGLDIPDGARFEPTA